MQQLNKLYRLLIVAAFLIPMLSQAQAPWRIEFKNANLVPQPNLDGLKKLPLTSSLEIVNGRIYRLIQFNDYPSVEEHEELENLGIHLFQAIPPKAYFASIPHDISVSKLRKMNARSILSIQPEWKSSRQVWLKEWPEWADKGDKIQLNISYFEDAPQAIILEFIQKNQVEVLLHSPEFKVLEIIISKNKVNKLVQQTFISWIETISPPSQPEYIRAKSLHRSNSINGFAHSSLQYDGTGVKVMTRDDGITGPHIDFKGRIELQPLTNRGTHGDLVTGCMAGYGNLDPTSFGSAPAATIYVTRYDARFTDGATNNAISRDTVVITNSSYSNGCNDGYTQSSATVDQQIFNNPKLLHVFSAGNSGTSNCGYGAGSFWGNVTGGHKVAKNAIAVGNLDVNDRITSSSSRGPAEDGRIKPEITAMGVNYYAPTENNQYTRSTGTSFSAPAAAGAFAQLYHVYKDLNQDQNPPSALMKAVMMNTADDLGNPGPDFIYGFGRVNVRRAYEVLKNRNYRIDTVRSAEVKTFQITVPTGTKQLKVMTYWADRPAANGATNALIDNLNSHLDGPGINRTFPLVLDDSPNATSLNRVAAPGLDSKNNMEQIVINNPQASTFTLSVTGRVVTRGSAPFYVVIEYVMDDVVLVYPNGGEGFVPGEGQYIRWDAAPDTATFSLEYSIDNGVSWSAIGGAAASVRQYVWVVPNTVSGQAMVRVNRGSKSDANDQPFSIIATPLNLDFRAICQEDVTLEWSAVPGATGYDIFLLGEKFMDSIATSTDTFYTINGFVHGLRYVDVNWFSVRAVGPNGLRSRRVYAISNIAGILLNCAPVAPISSFIVDSVLCKDKTYTMLDNSRYVPSLYIWTVSGGASSYVNGTDFDDQFPQIVFQDTGVYTIQLQTFNNGGNDIVIKTVHVKLPPQALYGYTVSGQTLTFSNSSMYADSYIWDFGDGNTSTAKDPVHTYANMGIYTVSLTAVSDACDNDAQTLSISLFPTAIGSLKEDISVEFYPNPAKGNFVLEIKGENLEATQVDLFDLQGKHKMQLTSPATRSAQKWNIDISDFAAGVYFIQIRVGEGMARMKLVVQ